MNEVEVDIIEMDFQKPCLSLFTKNTRAEERDGMSAILAVSSFVNLSVKFLLYT